MPDPLLTATLLAEITARDDAAGEGLMARDTFAAMDRHTLLMEVHRQQALINRLRQGQPAALREAIA